MSKNHWFRKYLNFVNLLQQKQQNIILCFLYFSYNNYFFYFLVNFFQSKFELKYFKLMIKY